MSDTLYAISTRLRDVIENGFALDDETGEVFDSGDLDAIEVALGEKAEAVLAVSRGYSTMAGQVGDEIKRLQDLKRYYERRESSLTDYLKSVVKQSDRQIIETPIGRMSIRRSSAVSVLDESSVPDEFMREKVTRSVDKVAVKTAFKDGYNVPGCAIVENENLSVR